MASYQSTHGKPGTKSSQASKVNLAKLRRKANKLETQR
jgi:hypothetical protein